jgi:hypothetical protein
MSQTPSMVTVVVVPLSTRMTRAPLPVPRCPFSPRCLAAILNQGESS